MAVNAIARLLMISSEQGVPAEPAPTAAADGLKHLAARQVDTVSVFRLQQEQQTLRPAGGQSAGPTQWAGSATATRRHAGLAAPH